MQRQICFIVFGFIQLFEPTRLSDMREIAGGVYACACPAASDV